MTVVQAKGAQTLSTLIQSRFVDGFSTSESNPESLQRLLFILKDLPKQANAKDALMMVGTEVLKAAGFGTGWVFGLQLPQLDLKFAPQEEDRDAVVVHSAALVTSRIALEWMLEMIRLTRLSQDLGRIESEALKSVGLFLKSSGHGMESGWTLRKQITSWVWRKIPVKWLRRAESQHVIADRRSIKLVQDALERLVASRSAGNADLHNQSR